MSSDEISFDFPRVTPEDWKKKISEDLKGKSFEDLIFKNEEFEIAPFYTAEDVEKIPDDSAFSKRPTGWKIIEKVFVEDIREASEQAAQALKEGTEGISFVLNDFNELGENDFGLLISAIDQEKNSVHFENLSKKNYQTLLLFFQKDLRVKKSLSGSFILKNPFSIDLLQEVISAAEKFSNFHFITIFPEVHSPVSSRIHSLFKQTKQLLEQASSKNVSTKKFLKTICFSVPVEKNFFIEIATLRAIRKLWTDELKKNGVENFSPLMIHANSFIEKNEDPWHFNILSATTIAMSAVIGGCDALSLTPAPIPGKSKEFSGRIFRNIQLLLKHESFFDKVNDPANGSFYVEKLTQQLLQEVQKHYT